MDGGNRNLCTLITPMQKSLRQRKAYCFSLFSMILTKLRVRELVSISLTFSFQFFTRLAAVFAEEVGDLFLFPFVG